MAVDKLVDSTQLDSDLTSVANAIRTKGGTQGQLAFPAGFVTAIQNIPSGGGGLVYESGTYSPSEDTTQPTISFSNSHSDPPTFAMIFDSNSSTVPSESGYALAYAVAFWYTKAGEIKTYYGLAHRRTTVNSSTAASTTALTSSNYSNYISSTTFTPPGASTNGIFKAGRSYQWVAVWW